MAYTTSTELIALTGTTLSASTLDAIIVDADRRIRSKITTAGLTPPATNDTLRSASIDLSKAGIVHYNVLTGAQTKRVTVGDITIEDDPYKAIKGLTESAWALVAGYIDTIDIDKLPIPGMVIVGQRGRRIGEYEEMTEDQEDDY